MKILLCGDRKWTNEQTIIDNLFPFVFDNPIIIHGAARGADTICGKVAERYNLKMEVFPANWNRFGNAAGMIRNRRMMKAKPDLVIAFHNDIDKSKGTKDMVRIAKEAGVEVRVIKSVQQRTS